MKIKSINGLYSKLKTLFPDERIEIISRKIFLYGNSSRRRFLFIPKYIIFQEEELDEIQFQVPNLENQTYESVDDDEYRLPDFPEE